MQQENFDQAIQDFKQAINQVNNINPELVNLIKPTLAQTYSERGFYNNHKGKIDQAIQINPKLRNAISQVGLLLAYTNRGVANSQQGKIDEAIQDFNKAITISPKSALPYYGRGIAYSLQGNKQQAIKDLEISKQLFQQTGNIQKAQEIQELLNQL